MADTDNGLKKDPIVAKPETAHAWFSVAPMNPTQKIGIALAALAAVGATYVLYRLR